MKIRIICSSYDNQRMAKCDDEVCVSRGECRIPTGDDVREGW